MTEKMHIGYVSIKTHSGAETILLQLPDDNQWGFVLADDDQSWPGGFGIASEWEALEDTDPRITHEDRERLQYLLDEARSN